MKVLCFGSLNIDHVYLVDHFVRPGETLAVDHYSVYCGGKGLNQSIALAKAGFSVYHAGKIGTDGGFLLEKLEQAHVNTDYILKSDEATGHAVIQVDARGQNCILLHGGTNQQIENADVDWVLEHFEEGDLCLLQNEISAIPYIIEKAKEKGLLIAFNPAPMTEAVKQYPLDKIDFLILNEIEAEALTEKNEPNKSIEVLQKKYPQCSYVITLGEKGALFGGETGICFQGAQKVVAVDTTAAGDTFTGYFLAGFIETGSPKEAMTLASRAAAICVTQKGAADSIPTRDEL